MPSDDVAHGNVAETVVALGGGPSPPLTRGRDGDAHDTWQSGAEAALLAEAAPAEGATGPRRLHDGLPRQHGLAGRAMRGWGAAALGASLVAVVIGYFISLSLSHSHSLSGVCSVSSSAASGVWGRARQLSRLDKALVILISFDGFRLDYHLKAAENGNISRFRTESTVAWDGMYPPFPSVTFPSHYSMATGLLPAWHGIVSNRFVDPTSREAFSPASTDPHWWLGEPIWETVTKAGLVAATMFWPGANVVKGAWDCAPERCFKTYNGSLPYEERVDTVLRWAGQESSSRPSLITLYFEEPDHSGHQGGPDTPLIPPAIARVDAALGRLLEGLQSLDILEDVNILLTSDHGMLSTCAERVLYLADLAQYVPGFDRSWVAIGSPFVGILPPSGEDVQLAFQKIVQALPKIGNGQELSIFQKAEFPGRFLISSSPRVPPILGLVGEGYLVVYDASDLSYGKCLGMHGYDNELASMRATFIAKGPLFAPGRGVKSFRNVEVYNIITRILGIPGAPNNGSLTLADDILLPF